MGFVYMTGVECASRKGGMGEEREKEKKKKSEERETKILFWVLQYSRRGREEEETRWLPCCETLDDQHQLPSVQLFC